MFQCFPRFKKKTFSIKLFLIVFFIVFIGVFFASMLPKFSLSLVLLVYTGRLIDTKSILLLRGISKSVRPRQTVPCPGARRRLIQGREKYLIIKFSQYFLKF